MGPADITLRLPAALIRSRFVIRCCVTVGKVGPVTVEEPVYSIAVANVSFWEFHIFRLTIPITAHTATKLSKHHDKNQDEVDQHSLFSPFCILPPHEIRDDGRRGARRTTVLAQVGKRPPCIAGQVHLPRHPLAYLRDWLSRRHPRSLLQVLLEGKRVGRSVGRKASVYSQKETAVTNPNIKST